MKKLAIFVSALLVFSAAFSQVDNPSKLSGSIVRGKFSFENVVITNGWKVSPVLNVLGGAERIKDGYNRTHSYDNYGLVLFEKVRNNNSTDSLSEFQVYFSSMEKNSISPEGFFPGTFKVENLTITSDLSAAELRRKLKTYHESESYLPHSYRLSSNGIYIYFQFDDSDTRLQKISIGPDRRN